MPTRSESQLVKLRAPDALRCATHVVQVGEAEHVTELVGHRADARYLARVRATSPIARSGPTDTAAHEIGIDLNETAARAGIVGDKGAPTEGRQKPPMGPDAGTAALTPDDGLDELHRIDDPVVVP